MTTPDTEDMARGGADLLVGGTGRVGRMLRRAWAPGGGPEFQQRREGPDLAWDPMAGPEPFLDWCDRAGGCRTMIVLAGVTVAPGADIAANAPVAEACLSAARAAGVARVLYASSSAIYGPGRGRPFTESDTPAPASPYGAAKAAAEDVCARHRDAGLAVTMLRIGNVAGADQLLINAGKAGPDAPLRLDRFADGGGPRRSYIGAGGFSRVLDVLRAAPDPPPVLNVGTPEPVAMEAIMEAAGVPWTWVPAPATAVQDLVLDCSALARIVPFAPAESRPAALVAEWRRYGDPQ